MIKRTKWFIKHSRYYMVGTKATIFEWLRAYVRFMWLSRNDG